MAREFLSLIDLRCYRDSNVLGSAHKTRLLQTRLRKNRPRKLVELSRAARRRIMKEFNWVKYACPTFAADYLSCSTNNCSERCAPLLHYTSCRGLVATLTRFSPAITIAACTEKQSCSLHRGEMNPESSRL